MKCRDHECEHCTVPRCQVLALKRKIANALCVQTGRAIRRVGDTLRAEPDSWPIPTDYTLRITVQWPDPTILGRVTISVTINACTVRQVVGIDGSARLLATSYIVIANALWGDYLLAEEPEFCASLRAKDQGVSH